MAKVIKRGLAIEPSDSADVVGYKLYAAPSPHEFVESDVGINIGLPPLKDIDGVQKHVVNLDAIPEVVALGEGEFDFGVSAVDDVGNESDLVKAVAVPLDLTPPNPPKSVGVIGV